MRINMVNGKAVKILEWFPHTVSVQFVKDGRKISVNRKYLQSFEVKEKPKKKGPDNQTSLFK